MLLRALFLFPEALRGFIRGHVGICGDYGVYRTPSDRALGPKYQKYYSICALKPYYLGPWRPLGNYFNTETPLSTIYVSFLTVAG